MNKVTPYIESDDNFIETKYSSSSSESSSSSDTNEHIIKLENIKNIPKKFSRWFKLISYFYDISLDNFPMGSFIGLILTICACSIISHGISSCESIINKYNSSMGQYITYHIIGIFIFITIHSCVLFHGISICALESSRECCGKKEVGCYCGICSSKKTKFGKKCRICQNITRKSFQMIWAIIGTLSLFFLYLISLFGIIFSSITTIISYILQKSCYIFSDSVNNLKVQAQIYLTKAKYYHNYTDNMMLSVLDEYNNWVNIKDSFVKSGIGQIENATSTIYVADPGVEKFIEKPSFDMYGRHLTEVFNPTNHISDGKSILLTFNTSIYETEYQLNYYDKQFKIIEEFCYDYSSIYDYLFMISTGILILLISQLIMFSVHYKYFSAWNYELQLINLSTKKRII